MGGSGLESRARGAFWSRSSLAEAGLLGSWVWRIFRRIFFLCLVFWLLLRLQREEEWNATDEAGKTGVEVQFQDKKEGGMVSRGLE